MKAFLSCFLIIIGTIIGAGFASGREIVTFFNSYEENGLYGIILASFFLGLVVSFVCAIVKKYDISEYRNLVNNNMFLVFTLKAFSFICFCIMISGVGAFFNENFNINFYYGSAIASLCCYTLFLSNFKGLEIVSNILVPFIICGIIFLGLSNYETINYYELNEDINLSANYTRNWLVSAILYASYNSLILIPILINFNKYKLSSKKIWRAGDNYSNYYWITYV